jgi:putative PIG3 family NAD(P)H quinone oxidoreductase
MVKNDNLVPMRAIVHTGPGGPEVLALREVPTPTPGPSQVLVRVRAAGLNRADILQRRGLYPAPPGWPADIPGLEYAGDVEGLGPGATRWRRGDRVMGLVGSGGHAEFVVVHEEEAIPVPDRYSWDQAAAIPEAFLTAWDALVSRGRLRAGERVLLHAVGSGVGTAAVQIARRLGATVIGTSRTAAKLDRVRELGLDLGLDSSKGSFREALDAPVDLVIDVLGGPAFADNLAVLAPRGRLVLLGFLQGPRVETSLEPVLRKRLEVIGTVMRTRGAEERRTLARAFGDQVLPDLTSGALRPVVGAVYPMADIASAHAAMEADSSFGKIILTWNGTGPATSASA